MSSDLNSEEQHLRDMLDSSMSGVQAPENTEDRARTAGRQIRARRWIGVGLSAAAVAAVVAVGLPNVIGGGGGSKPTEDTPVATTDHSSPTESPDSDKLPKKSTSPDLDLPTPPAWTQKTAGEIAEILEGLLPQGVTVSHVARPHGSKGYLSARIETPSGPSAVEVILEGPDQGPGAMVVESDEGGSTRTGAPTDSSPKGEQRYNCDPEWVVAKYCTVVTDAHGATVGRVLESRPGDLHEVGSTVVTSDDGTVMISMANTLADKWRPGSPISAPDVPLDADRVTAIASDPAWTN